MKTAGIIAEFDPFHNGHRYLIDRLRAEGYTHIAIAMSGSAVQRGSLAVYDKQFRAETAVRFGADLVIEIPAPYSCSNAEVFAGAGVAALAALGEGVIGTLAFGSETDDLSLLIRASDAADALKDSELVRRYLASGDSYPAAVSKACEAQYGREVASVFMTPNSTLALEYCRAIRRSAPFMTPFAVKRFGSTHDADGIYEGFASASYIRKLILSGDDITELVPAADTDHFDPVRISNILLYSLQSADKEMLLSTPDTDEAIADRVLNTSKGSFPSLSELLDACKAKNITRARLSRLALHAVLRINKSDILPLPYARVLAFNERGRELLGASQHVIPVDTSLSRLTSSSPTAARVAQIEQRAGLLRSLGTVSGKNINDHTRQIRISGY